MPLPFYWHRVFFLTAYLNDITHRETHLAEIMPDGGRIIRAYRYGRIVKRRQEMGPYIVYLRGCLFHAIYHIADMLLIKL